MIKLLAKSNDDVLSFCRCSSPLASLPSQLDCPWCGCGWLICCTHCHKAFTYARIVELETDYETYIQEDRQRGGWNDLKFDELKDAASWMRESLEYIPTGEIVIYLDGRYIQLDNQSMIFTGLYASHKLRFLPHFEALTAPKVLSSMLGARSYWIQRAVPQTTE